MCTRFMQMACPVVRGLALQKTLENPVFLFKGFQGFSEDFKVLKNKVCVCVYIYIYIYTYLERERERESLLTLLDVCACRPCAGPVLIFSASFQF